MLRAMVKNYGPATACAATLIVCYLLVRPYAEIGYADDWSYIKTAQVLAQTGHVVYNGWATAMLGWQLYVGALFVKLFGFSFTTIRFSTVIEAVTTAFLLQRTFVRAGLNSWNATLATLAFVFSSDYLPLAFTFLTDISGVLCIVACLYMCLRALDAESERSAMIWISLAALVNAVGGTGRQIVWLGVLVMVPSTLWLLRRRRHVLVAGSLSCLAGAVLVVAATQWFARQPYAITVSLIPGSLGVESVKDLLHQARLSAGQLAQMSLPVLLMFAVSLRSWGRRLGALMCAGLVCFLALGHHEQNAKGGVEAPVSYFAGYPEVSASQKLNEIVARNVHLPNHDILGGLVAALVVLGIFGLAICILQWAPEPPLTQGTVDSISWVKLGFVLGPFSAAYIAVLALFTFRNGAIFGRYLLPLLLILLLILTRCYQEKLKMKLPLGCGFLIMIVGAFNVAAAHDDFAWFRGSAIAIDEIRSGGVSATAILGPWEYLGWAQIESEGHINDRRIRIPQGAYAPQSPPAYLVNCDPDLDLILQATPAMKPAYAVTPDPGWCGGKIAFPPVLYRTWFAPQANWIYAIKLPPPSLDLR
jgi:hypothetical protein